MLGQNTRAITDGDAWLKSLDAVGMVTARGILIEAFSVLQNIAMSFTLDVDPIDPRVVPEAGALARDVGIDPALFDVPAGKAGPEVQMRVHLARALALGPKLLIAEHASAPLPRTRWPRSALISQEWRSRAVSPSSPSPRTMCWRRRLADSGWSSFRQPANCDRRDS